MTYPQKPGGYDPHKQPGNTQPGNYPSQQPGFFVPTAADPGPRPKIVTVAAMIMLLTVLGNVGVGLLMGFGMIEADSVDEVDQGGAIAMGVASVVIGIGFIVVALGVLRGRDGARTVAFVLYGISVCCGSVITLGATGYAFDPEEDSGAGGVALMAMAVAAFLAYVTVILLLAMPASGQWFRANALARRAGVIR